MGRAGVGYFLGHEADQPHPYFTSAPEPAGICELCRLPKDDLIHIPWEE